MNSTLLNKSVNNNCKSDLENWFDDFVAGIRADQLIITTGNAPKALKDLYTSMMEQDFESIVKSQLPIIHKFMITNSLHTLFEEIRDIISRFEEFALHLSKHKIQAWIVIPDDDDELDKTLLLKIANVNFKIKEHGYFIDLMTFEKSDNISIPSHYYKVAIR